MLKSGKDFVIRFKDLGHIKPKQLEDEAKSY
jgi:hypothetical protein